MNTYLYLLSITAWVKSDSSSNIYNFIQSTNSFYESLEEAIECGVLYIDQNIFYELANGDENNISSIIELFENNKNYGYNFDITKICCNYLKFKSDEDMYEYYKNNIHTVSKENLYDFLIKIAKIEHLKYSYSGRLIDSELGNLDINTCSTRAFDEKHYHCDNFNIGDYVKRKEFGDNIYIIDSIENKNKSIYNSDDPWNFAKGYLLRPINEIELINDYEAYRFMDEDLESIN